MYSCRCYLWQSHFCRNPAWKDDPSGEDTTYDEYAMNSSPSCSPLDESHFVGAFYAVLQATSISKKVGSIDLALVYRLRLHLTEFCTVSLDVVASSTAMRIGWHAVALIRTSCQSTHRDSTANQPATKITFPSIPTPVLDVSG